MASGITEVACTRAVNGDYGGNVKNVRVTSSEFSQASSKVMMSAIGVWGGSNTEYWESQVFEDGEVRERTVVDR